MILITAVTKAYMLLIGCKVYKMEVSVVLCIIFVDIVRSRAVSGPAGHPRFKAKSYVTHRDSQETQIQCS